MAMKFDVIKTEDLEHLKKQVNYLLQSGWELNGEMKAFPAAVGERGEVTGIVYVQSVKFGEA